MSPDGLQASIEKMRSAGVGDAAIDTFAHYYEQLREGASGMLPESDIEPVEDLPTLDELPEGDPAIVDTAVVLKLNGGLGTSMGMTKAKSLIEAKEGQTFLDIVVGQVLGLRERFGARVPLVLMNSSPRATTRSRRCAATRRSSPTCRSTSCRTRCRRSPPTTCSRSRGRPTRRSSGRPPATATSTPRSSPRGCSTRCSSTAIATPSSRTPTTSAPSSTRGSSPGSPTRSCRSRWRSPGAPRPIARAGTSRGCKDGRPRAARDGADAEEDLASLQDVGRHRYVNTNNLWVGLEALRDTLQARDGVLGLPIIVNRKTVDPSDPESPPVVQLETAMGAAIGVFEGARALHVPRRRFAPVKTTNDLLALRSDAYVLHERPPRRARAEREEPPVIDLDPDYYKLVGDFEPRFPAGPPSLVACERLTVVGDVTFGRDVVVRGAVTVQGPARIEDGDEYLVRIAVVQRPHDREHCPLRPGPQPSGMAPGRFLLA